VIIVIFADQSGSVGFALEYHRVTMRIVGRIESIRLGGDYASRFGEDPLPDLLIGILRGNLTGVLNVDFGANKDDRVYFRDGVPVCVVLPSVGVSLAEILVACGEIERSVGISVQRESGSGNQTESVVFSKMDACPDGALQNGMRIRARAEMVRLFDAGDRAFHFQEGTSLPDLAEVTILQPLPLIYEGLLSAKDRSPLRSFLEETQGRWFKLVDTYPAGVDAFEWGKEVEVVVNTMCEAQSIEQLIKKGLPPDQVAVVLATLSLTGMIEAVEAPSGMPKKLRLRTMATSGEYVLPAEQPLTLRPISGISHAMTSVPEPMASPAIDNTKDFRDKVLPLVGKNYFEILRVTPSSKADQLERAVRFLSKNIDSQHRGERAVAHLALEAHRVLASPVQGPKYRECLRRAEENPRYLTQRYQMEVDSKIDLALASIAEGHLDEADVWLTWAAKLDPTRSDLRLHRAFLSFCRAQPENRPVIASALRELLAQESLMEPSDVSLQVYLACVVACLGDTKMVQVLRNRAGVLTHPLAPLIERFTQENSCT
jgi:hypothetical protein